MTTAHNDYMTTTRTTAANHLGTSTVTVQEVPAKFGRHYLVHVTSLLTEAHPHYRQGDKRTFEHATSDSLSQRISNAKHTAACDLQSSTLAWS